jgi:hypothetical protein
MMVFAPALRRRASGVGEMTEARMQTVPFAAVSPAR